MTVTYADVFGDLDAAIRRLRMARRTDAAEQRRALNEAMGCVYRLRNRVVELVDDRGRYRQIVSRDLTGRIVEAIVLVRGAGEHDFMRDVEPRARSAYPGPRTFPSYNLFPDDHNLYWRDRSELGYDLTSRDAQNGPRLAGYYDAHLAGYLVLDTLEAARGFFGERDRLMGTHDEWWPPLP
ncbi:hypothetical protein QUV83_10230 [Cellulomonas cellasea]|uniref:hypothetical protein n=1 Tax=Cellulomonas cellasea TaxID=43670 RepID=UPI0025A315D3|nr:hypothetical protein [Cellulomonas cellasea]MDM8085142.1 hypothetical protein [Cellulomonas cellasea]